MNIYENVYIGIVDILGYGNLETKLKQFGLAPSAALITKIFDFLDTTINGFRKNTSITWTRYGDGYIFYSKDSNVSNLSEIVKKNCMLLALSLNQSIPLRVVITQNTLNVDETANGTTISGEGWNILRKIEPSLEWMGGFLYLPNYDGTHHDTVQKLIQTSYLIIKQTNVLDVKFNPPFKKNLTFSTSKTWFLNWQKCFHQSKSILDKTIETWWSQFSYDSAINASITVKKKQKNSIEFADYCRELHKASNLLFHSGIDKNIDIGIINGSC